MESQPIFAEIFGIYLILVLKLAVTALTSLYFRTLWPNWLKFFVINKISIYQRKMTENYLGSRWYSGTRWGKCRAAFAIELGFLWDLELQRNLKSLIWLQIFTRMQIDFWFAWIGLRTTKEFEHSVVNNVSSNSSAGVWYNNRSPKCKSCTFIYSATVCYSFMLLLLVRATAWLAVLDG